MGKGKPVLLFLLLLATTGVPALAEPWNAAPDTSKIVGAPTDTQVVPLPLEILVTAPRLVIPLRDVPGAVSVVRRETLLCMPKGIGMDEALELVPGVKIDNQANGERVHISIRGQGILTETGIRSVKILQDEIPLNDPSGFVPDLFDVDVHSLDRIEIFRGPATSLYGGGAAGGVINVETQGSGPAPLSAGLGAMGGSNTFWNGFGHLGGQINDLNYRLSVSQSAADGYRVHTHFHAKNFYGKAAYTPDSSLRIVPILSWTDTFHENPEGLSLAQYQVNPKLANDDAVPFNEHMEMQRATAGITGSLSPSSDKEIRFAGYLRRSKYVEANNAVFDHQSLMTTGTSFQCTLTSAFPSAETTNRISVGADLQWQTNDEYLNPNNFSMEGADALARQRIRQRGVGLYILDQCLFLQRWSATGSLRLDRTWYDLADLMKTDSTDNSGNADFTNVTARLGLTYSPSAALTFYGSWGMGFIPPSTEELGTDPNGYGGFNSSLKAATSQSAEAGVRGTLGQIGGYELGGFFLTTSQDFDRYRIPGRGNGEEGTFFRNVGGSRRFGIELSADYDPAAMVELQVSYTYSHFTYHIDSPIPVLMDDTTLHKAILDGHWLPNSPQHQLATRVTLDVTPELSISMNSLTMSKSYIDGANIESEAVRGFTLLGGRIAYRLHLGGLSGVLSLSARNLGDVKYVAFSEPDPGRASYHPGAGREIFGGFTLQL